MRRIAIQPLLALSSAHNHDVIHTRECVTVQRRASNNASSWDTVSNLLFIDATTSNIFLKTRDYRRIESVYLAQQIPRQDKTRRHYTVILSAPLCDHYIDKSKSKGLGTVLGDRASLQ